MTRASSWLDLEPNGLNPSAIDQHTRALPRTRHEVAYELWCIHENFRVDNRSPEGIGGLLDRLRERHPYLSDALIEQGLALFTENLFRELEQRLISRRRWLSAHQRVRSSGP